MYNMNYEDDPDGPRNLYAMNNQNLVFQQNDLFPSAFPCMEEIRRQGRLCDVVLKACCISVVWRCYKFLTLKQQNIRNTIHFIAFDATDGRMADADYSSILCGQEAAICGRLSKQTPPPSYQDVMGDQPPPYPASVEVFQETPPQQFRAVTVETPWLPEEAERITSVPEEVEEVVSGQQEGETSGESVVSEEPQVGPSRIVSAASE